MWRSLLLLALAVPLSAAQNLTSTLGALQGIPVEDEQSGVPPDATLLMSNAKDALRDLAIATLQGQPGTAAAIAPQIQNRLEHAAAVADGDVAERFGDIIGAAVTSPAPNLLAVEYTLNIPCGSDAQLLLFRFDRTWKLVYERREDGYDSIAYALGSFEWRISPPDPQGRFLVLTASISPGCNSNWHTFVYRAEHVDPQGGAPVLIDEGKAPSFGWDYEISTGVESYSIRFQTRACDDAGFVRDAVLDVRVENDRPVRQAEECDSAR